MLFDEEYEDNEIEFEYESFKDALENFTLSPYNAENLSRLSIERQVALRTHARQTIEIIQEGDEEAAEYIEKSLYDLLLTCSLGRDELMRRTFSSVCLYAGGVETAWKVIQSYAKDVMTLKSALVESETIVYACKVLKAYEDQFPYMCGQFDEALEYYAEENYDEELLGILGSCAPVLVIYKETIIPTVNVLLGES